MKNDRKEITDALKEQIRGSGYGAPFVMCTGSPIPSNIDPEAINYIIDEIRSGKLEK